MDAANALRAPRVVVALQKRVVADLCAMYFMQYTMELVRTNRALFCELASIASAGAGSPEDACMQLQAILPD